MLCIHLRTSVSWPPTLHRLYLFSVMKPTEVFIYVQCNPCIGKLTVISTKAFNTFIIFSAVDLDFALKSTVGLCSFSN